MSPGSVAAVRRLLLLVAVLVAVDTMLYAALTPLLPHFATEFGLSKGQAGVLVAAYAAGALVFGLPGGVAAVRLGARRAVLIGLTLMGLASLGFAFVGSFWGLFAARFIQGAGSAFTWAGALAWLLAVAPKERRGELLGTAMGAAVFGALFGPVIGALAALLGRSVVFTALSGLGGGARRVGVPARGRARRGAVVGRRWPRRCGTARFLLGLVLMTLPALLFGILSVLGPLHLSDAGWGAAAIGGVWLVAAALESIEGPLVGRLVDRRGSMFPVRISLAAGTVLSVALAFGGRPVVYVPLLVLGEPGVRDALHARVRAARGRRGRRRARAGHGLRPDERGVGDGRRPRPGGGRRDRRRDGRHRPVPARGGAVRRRARRCAPAHRDGTERALRTPLSCDPPGRIAQRESARFTRERSLVRSQRAHLPASPASR